MLKKSLILLIIVLSVAAFFRFWMIDSMPGGLFPDEAANGTDAVLILEGEHSPFFERGLGRETLFFYMIAGSIALFGIGVWQIHIISAIIGTLNVLATWLFAKTLFNTRIAFLASIFMASSAWHVTHSRTGFRAILVPLFATLFFYFAYLVFKSESKKKKTIFAILTGASLGFGFYTYISFRAMWAIVGVLAIVLLIINRKLFIEHRKQIIVGIIAFLVVSAPLITYFITHPGTFTGRAGCVSIFSEDLNNGDVIGTFLWVAQKTFWMFFTEGDLNWRHNVSGYSMLNPFVAIFFTIGFIYSIAIILINLFKNRIFKKEYLKDWFIYFVLLLWFFGQLGIELLTAEGIPHGLRAMGIIPAVFIFSAIAIDLVWKRMKANSRKYKAFAVLIAIAVVSNVCYDYALYFGIAANSPGAYYAYRSDLTVVSQYLNERNQEDKTYLVLDEYSVQTVDFLTTNTNQPYKLVDPATSYQTQLNPSDQIVFTQSTIFDTAKWEKHHPETELIKKELNRFGEEIMRVYKY